MQTNEQMTPTVYAEDGTVVGWVWGHGCENPACLAATAEGYPWHACPRVGDLKGNTFHFATEDEARLVLLAVHRSGMQRPEYRERLEQLERLAT